MELSVHSPGSPSSTLYTTIHLSDSEDMGKRRRKRTIISSEQLSKLEGLFKQEQWPNRERKEKLAKEIVMSSHFVNIWFQNKRSRMKKMAQEEAELAALRKEDNKLGMPGHVGVVVVPDLWPVEKQETVAMNHETESRQTSKVSPGRPSLLLRPIAPLLAPKSPMTPTMASKIKKEYPTEQKLSPQPQVVCVKLALPAGVATSLSPIVKIPKLQVTQSQCAQSSTATVNTDNESQNTCRLTRSASSSADARTASEFCKTSKLSGDTEMQQTSSPAAQQMKKLAQQSLHQQQVHAARQAQSQVQKPAQVRFGTNPAVVLNKLSVSRNALEQLDSSSTEVASEDQPSGSNSASEDTNPPPNYSLFNCLVAMAAVEEGGGIIQQDDPNYDMAVNSTLYGVKIDDDEQEVVLKYDKKKGLRFSSNETDDEEI